MVKKIPRKRGHGWFLLRILTLCATYQCLLNLLDEHHQENQKSIIDPLAFSLYDV